MRDAVVTTLCHICQGGINDHLAGGFACYSVDELWLVPDSKKNAHVQCAFIDLLTRLRETHEPLFAMRIAETVGWSYARNDW